MQLTLTYLAVALGSALGGMARYWLGTAIAVLTGPQFPWGTLLINVLGSFVIGVTAAVTLAPARFDLHSDLRIFIMVGLCGGFTTFSAFSLQTLGLLQEGDLVAAGGYILASVFLCVVATWGGWAIGRL